ncbi:MAG: Gfo/Idh/MocA family oxidoreductase [Candidatus Nanopelagicales bacterium]|nr:Gfo/Idh/MocA family oxidoreductase [Candidatus Nanopelagicales bacterium]MCF8537975.1 Gfo/Idh/MocA family oxidoreductase [Candidatus Nanopelagicales bacterium]MCF8543030.1 Gfo/Idh/MocA family oxidoreductase [Candidatus Nanopelagicales bacterium]MCF8557944.1 Gfo/Idh/MocA family oxidoreductase [Candidatus Nanopelagicales bacterium]
MERIGIAVLGLGWMGQAHSRSALRIPSLFPDRAFHPELVVCADVDAERRERAVRDFGFARAVADWQEAVESDDVDAVWVTAPNMLHVPMIEAACAAGKHVFSEKPIGGRPDQAVAAFRAAESAGVRTGVGYNYLWSPLVLHARALIESGALGEITHYRGRFLSMYGSDELGLLTWRFFLDQAGYGVTSDILSHSVSLAQFLVGPIAEVVGMRHTTIPERPLPQGTASHYGRGSADDPKGAVENEDFASMLCRFGQGATGTFEASRTTVGPESQNAFEVYGTKGALAWNLETLNELRYYRIEDGPNSGYTTIYGGDRFPFHGAFAPGQANAIGFEDLVAIEDFAFMEAVATGAAFSPSFAEAVDVVNVQQALIDSWDSRSWESVRDLADRS